MTCSDKKYSLRNFGKPETKTEKEKKCRHVTHAPRSDSFFLNHLQTTLKITLKMSQPQPKPWYVDSWRSKPAKQQVEYADQKTFENTVKRIQQLPPLISKGEVLELRKQLAEVAAGQRFLLQGGDCAERFVDCESGAIEQKLKIMLQMSLVLTWGARMPTVRVARMAGQFAKPRSSPTEVVNGKVLQKCFFYFFN